MSEFKTPVEQQSSFEIVEKKENVFTGIIGAVIGALIGFISLLKASLKISTSKGSVSL